MNNPQASMAIPKSTRYVINLPPEDAEEVPPLHILRQPQPIADRFVFSNIALCGEEPTYNDPSMRAPRWYGAWLEPPRISEIISESDLALHPEFTDDKLKLCEQCDTIRKELDDGSRPDVSTLAHDESWAQQGQDKR